MKHVEIFTPFDQGYKHVCAFARTVYKRELAFTLTRFPEVLFAIIEDNQVYGCMGLNRDFRFPLFVHDERLTRIMNESGRDTVFGEQSTFALERCSFGLPVLISVTAAYAFSIGIHKIVYAAIGVSERAIESLGFETISYGPVRLDVLPRNEYLPYVPWYDTHHPVCYILDTHTAPAICESVFKRFTKKVTFGERLKQKIYGAHRTC